MSHDRDKSHDCKMVDLSKPYSLHDWRVDNKLMKLLSYKQICMAYNRKKNVSCHLEKGKYFQTNHPYLKITFNLKCTFFVQIIPSKQCEPRSNCLWKT